MGTNKAEETPLKKMDSDRIKEIQDATAYPNSQSVMQALLQVWNECSQQNKSEIDELTKERDRLQSSLLDVTNRAIELTKEVEILEEWNKIYEDNQVENFERVKNQEHKIVELTKEVERLMKERDNSLKEKMYFNRMKELVSKVAYDSEHYTQKTYEVLRNDAIGLLNEYNLTTH